MRRGMIVALAAVLLLVLVAPAAAVEPAPEVATPVTVSVVGPFTAGSPEGDALQAEFGVFTVGKAIDIVYEPYAGVADLMARVTGPEPPDLILVPQPAALIELAPYVVALSDLVNERKLRRDYGDYLIDLVSVDGVALGGPIKIDLKSLVWYKPAEFAAWGYQIPQSFDELVALSDSMVANGQWPWCNYMESGFATGWMGTDWVEDLLLGAEGPAVYDQWVAHDVLFQDPRVEEAFERFMQMIDTAGYVFDRSNMTNFSFVFNALPLDAGDCLMHKQASYFAGFIQDFGGNLEEFAAFKFPAVNPEFAESANGGGGVFVSALNERDEVRLLLRFLLSQRFGREGPAAVGGWILPNTRFDTARYGDDLTRSFAEIAQAALDAGQYTFDASDLMPPEVGAGEFWFGIRDLVDGVRFLPDVLADIDAAWPS